MENNKDNNKHLYIGRDGHSYKTLEDYLKAEEEYERLLKKTMNSSPYSVNSLPYKDINSKKKKR